MEFILRQGFGLTESYSNNPQDLKLEFWLTNYSDLTID